MNKEYEHERWGSKEAKKAGQKFRREARNIFAEYQKSLADKLDEIRLIIRPRPFWMPRKVWLWFADFFVDFNSAANKALIFESPSDYLTRKHNEAVSRTVKTNGGQQEEQGAEYEESDEIEDLVDDKGQGEVIHT